ncbi:MAG: hypothetical protein ACFFG0_24395 [Candidatus Thorarchaeota archaeon]
MSASIGIVSLGENFRCDVETIFKHIEDDYTDQNEIIEIKASIKNLLDDLYKDGYIESENNRAAFYAISYELQQHEIHTLSISCWNDIIIDIKRFNKGEVG